MCALQTDGVMKLSGFGIVLFFSAIGPFAALWVWYGWIVLPIFFVMYYLSVAKTRGTVRIVTLTLLSYSWLYTGMSIMAMNG